MLVKNLDLDNMKKLQNNYTNTEQSKRLLELGLPADSADCFYHEGGKWVGLFQFGDKISDFPARFGRTPCWSVGRLMELYMKAKGLDFMYFRIMRDADMIDSIVRMFVENQNEIDFSKLED